VGGAGSTGGDKTKDAFEMSPSGTGWAKSGIPEVLVVMDIGATERLREGDCVRDFRDPGSVGRRRSSGLFRRVGKDDGMTFNLASRASMGSNRSSASSSLTTVRASWACVVSGAEASFLDLIIRRGRGTAGEAMSGIEEVTDAWGGQASRAGGDEDSSTNECCVVSAREYCPYRRVGAVIGGVRGSGSSGATPSGSEVNCR
jgi:hypothetical protein